MIINVTKTFFPSEEVYNNYVKQIWQNGWLTNHGALSILLKDRLSDFLKVEQLMLTSNGTIPIQIAIKALALEGEIITTPFSYIATSAAIVWEQLKPVFVDIHPEYLSIDESKIESAITPRTTAILATHVFGNPCNVEAIEYIALKHNLKVIYDAAHSFDVKYKGQSIFNYGDISTCSFHATKLFHTGEGGALICQSPEIFEKSKQLGNFGHSGQYDFHGLGINAKMSELHAAMGLSVLGEFDHIKSGRKRAVEHYRRCLNFETICEIKIRENTEWNYSYYPIIFDQEEDLLNTISDLNALGIFPRRYFYPSLNTVEYLKGQVMPISESISKRILCLPLFADLQLDSVEQISSVVNNVCELNRAQVQA